MASDVYTAGQESEVMALTKMITPITVSEFDALGETAAVDQAWAGLVVEFNHPWNWRDPRLKPAGDYTAYRVLDHVEIRYADGQLVKLYGGATGPEYPELKFIRFEYEAVGCPSE